ncbi:oxidoreductase-like domain-containing protein [Rheinheimera sp.]|uniref:oxidoreductase-like domain-containing protein n=1 Tax=Rheinheimera sp. TaxID=1869214 RepID=UPI0025D52DBC|nr:oxidoreductase-like domain-containing protein [Rheinheimera sp.]
MKLIEKPEPPGSNECCGSGSCCPCVWDYYREQLALWQQQQASLQSAEQAAEKTAEQAVPHNTAQQESQAAQSPEK